MTDWLYRLPELLLIAMSAGLSAAAAISLPRLIQRIPVFQPTDPGFEFVIRMQAPLFTMTALVLAFTLVEAERNFRQADSNLTTEASQISQLDRLLTRYDDPATTAVRAPLLAYAHSIITDEWPDMLRGSTEAKIGQSTKTGLAFALVSRGVMAIDPKPGRQAIIYAEMLKSMDAIAQSRDARLDNVKVCLPWVYWIVILFSVSMVQLVSCAIPRTPFRTAVIAAQLAVLGAFVGFVFVMDAPFKGETAVSPAEIARAVAVMERRQK